MTVRTVVTPEEAVSRIRDGDVIMVGGFGLVGAPLTLIDALVETTTARDLTIVSNNVGEAGRGLGKLLRQGRIRKAIASYFTSNPEAVAAAQAGELEYELLPQGTLAEAIRAGGAGLGGFYTPVGAGTDARRGQGGAAHRRRAARARAAAQGRRRAGLRGPRRRARQPLVPAHGAQLQHRHGDGGRLHARRRSARSSPLGGLEPESVHTPHLYVDALVAAPWLRRDVRRRSSRRAPRSSCATARS